MLDPNRTAFIKKIEKARGSRVICYITSDRENATGKISRDVIPVFVDHLRKMGKQKKIDLFLFTRGGQTLAGFNIAQLLRQFSDDISVLVPLHCHSSGTLIALGANQIVMPAAATLSPIDPSLETPLNPVIELNPGQRQLVSLSVESVAGFRDLVTEQWGIKGEDGLGHAFRTLAEKVHPLALGDVFRARKQIEELARKLLKSHRQEDEQALVPIIETLTKNLGSHDYPISPKEAKALLGSQVSLDTEGIDDDLWDLLTCYRDLMQFSEPFDVNVAVQAAKGQALSLTVKFALVESGERVDVFEQDLHVAPPAQPPAMPPGFQFAGQPVPTVKVVRTGWKRYS